MQRIGVLVHPSRPVQSAVEILKRWTEDRRLELVQIVAGDQPPVAAPGEVTACDLVTALGGDGTVLKALHVAARTRTPVMGVALGSLGALTTVPENGLRTALDRFAADDWHPRSLPALDVRANGEHVGWAINDLVLTRRGGNQLVLDVYVEEDLYARLAGDGVVIATALGSSAYSMAGGGSLLAAGVNAFICTPLAMHGGCAPPLVVSDDRPVSVELHPGFDGFDVEIDGFLVETTARGFTVTSERAHATLADIDHTGVGIRGLRERGLIIDSPRVAARSSRPSPPA